MTNKYWNWLPTYLNFSAIYIQLSNIRWQNISLHTNSQKKHCVCIFYRFQVHFQAAVLFATEIEKLFVNRLEPFKFNISMTTHYNNLKNISGRSRYHALSIYIHEKVENLMTLSLNVWQAFEFLEQPTLNTYWYQLTFFFGRQQVLILASL